MAICGLVIGLEGGMSNGPALTGVPQIRRECGMMLWVPGRIEQRRHVLLLCCPKILVKSALRLTTSDEYFPMYKSNGLRAEMSASAPFC